jgi:hypothetical protein
MQRQLSALRPIRGRIRRSTRGGRCVLMSREVLGFARGEGREREAMSSPGLDVEIARPWLVFPGPGRVARADRMADREQRNRSQNSPASRPKGRCSRREERQETTTKKNRVQCHCLHCAETGHSGPRSPKLPEDIVATIPHS